MFLADLHIHSHYARATSRQLVPEMLALWGRRKGLGVIGTGDFTHPGWRTELADALIEAEPGLYRLRPELAMPDDWHVPIPRSRGLCYLAKSAPSIKNTARCARCTTCS